jgi:hypothetical protein
VKEAIMIQAQVHAKFKVFILEDGIGFEEAMNRLARMVETFVRESKVAVKSVGVEYLEGQKRLVASFGYRDDEPAYPVKIRWASMGKLDLFPDAIEAAMAGSCPAGEAVICHEFFVTGEGEFVMVQLVHG